MEHIVDAGEAMTAEQTTTPETLQKEKVETPSIETIVEETKTEEKKEEVKTVEEIVEKEEVVEEETKEDEEEIEEEVTEEEDKKEISDVLYIKQNPEAVLDSINALWKEAFDHKHKYDLEVSARQALEEKYKELQKEKYSDKYDDANLPVLEEKRSFWRSQNKYYADSENETNKQTYIQRLKEELEDIEGTMKTVSADTKIETKQDKIVEKKFESSGRVGVRVNRPLR